MLDFIADCWLPRYRGRADLRNNSDSFVNRQKQAATYCDLLNAECELKQKEMIKRNLTPLRKQIAPFELDHDKFLQAIEERIREIAQLPGVSEEDKTVMIQSAKSTSVFTIETNGQRRVLDISVILKQKRRLCIEANKRIDRTNDCLTKLLAKYRYRLANYLRAINKIKNDQEIKGELTFKPTILPHWDFSTVFSSRLPE